MTDKITRTAGGPVTALQFSRDLVHARLYLKDKAKAAEKLSTEFEQLNHMLYGSYILSSFKQCGSDSSYQYTELTHQLTDVCIQKDKSVEIYNYIKALECFSLIQGGDSLKIKCIEIGDE